jgi:ubiquinone/menaquinone biosynthesis C-methylase UbiE
MSLYDTWILPRIIDAVMRQKHLARYRAEVVGSAQGRVLEIGVGSGLNLHYYGERVEQVIGLDPSPRLLELARQRAANTSLPVEFVLGSATAIPLADASIDTIVMTWTLCSVPDAAAALREMHRVLKPGGRLLFVEHGLAPESAVVRWQHRLTPIWRRVAGGCHLDRRMDELIRGAGFDLSQLQTGYAPGPRPMAFMYQGCACRAAVTSVVTPGLAESSHT